MIRLRSLRPAALAALALVLASSVAFAAAVAHDLTGTWDFEVVTENGTGTPTVKFAQKGDSLSGTYESRMMGVRALKGVVKGDSLFFELAPGGEAQVVLAFKGRILDADRVSGVVDFGGMGGAQFNGARRK